MRWFLKLHLLLRVFSFWSTYVLLLNYENENVLQPTQIWTKKNNNLNSKCNLKKQRTMHRFVISGVNCGRIGYTCFLCCFACFLTDWSEFFPLFHFENFHPKTKPTHKAPTYYYVRVWCPYFDQHFVCFYFRVIILFKFKFCFVLTEIKMEQIEIIGQSLGHFMYIPVMLSVRSVNPIWSQNVAEKTEMCVINESARSAHLTDRNRCRRTEAPPPLRSLPVKWVDIAL